MSTVSGTTDVGVTLLAANNPITIAAGAYIDAANSSIALYGAGGTTWTITNDGSIVGQNYGVRLAGVGSTVTNAGFIEANYRYGVDLLAGGVVNNGGTGTIGVANDPLNPAAAAVQIAGGAGTITNAGLITSGVPASVELAAGYTNLVIVDPGGSFVGTVNGGNAMLSGAISTLELARGTSAGVIGTLSGLGTQFVDFAQTTIDNGASWVLTGINTIVLGATLTDSGALTVAAGAMLTDEWLENLVVTGGGSLTNAGGIEAPTAQILQLDGVYLRSGSVTNLSGGTIYGYVGVYLVAGGVTNQSGGAISGYSGVRGQSGGGTVVNDGWIAGNANGGPGVALIGPGSDVINESGGTISGYVGVVLGLSGTLVNAGTVAGLTYGNISVGVYLQGGGVTNLSSGTISGIRGVFGFTSDAAVTVANAGVISGTGGYAVSLAPGYANWVVIDPGAVFAGTVSGGNTIGATQVSTLELASGASTGLVSGLGSEYIDFAQITIDAGASWFLSGANTLAAGATLSNAGSLTVLAGALSGAGSVINNGVILDDDPALRLGSLAGTGEVVVGYGVRLTVTGPHTQTYTVGLGGEMDIDGTITNAALLVSGTYVLDLAAGGSVTNQSSGRMVAGTFGVTISGGAGTVVNAGSISGGTAAVTLAAGYTNRVTADPGAVFAGTVDGGNTVNAVFVSTLELAPGATTGMLSGLGSQFIDFAQTTIDAGALWTLTGANTLAAGGALANSGQLTLFEGGLSDAGSVINNGLIEEDAATMTAGTLTGTGLVVIGGDSTLTTSGTVAAGETVAFAGAGLLALAPAEFSGQIDGLGGGGRIELTGITDATSAGVINGNILAIQQSAGPTLDLTLDPTQSFAGVVFPIATLGGNQFVDASEQVGPTVIDQGETESVTGAAASTLATVDGAVGGIAVTGANSLLITTTDVFIVGDASLGTLSVDAGGAAEAQDGMLIANTSGASGSSVEVSGAGSDLAVTGGLTVGQAGSGSLLLSAGAAATAGALVVAAAATGDGDVALSGAGTTLDVTGVLTLGGGAAGEMSILGGAQMTVGGGVVGSSDAASGNLDVEGAGSQLTINIGTLTVGANGPAEFNLGIGATLHGEVANGPFGVVNEYGSVDPPTDPNDGTQNVGFGNSLIYDFYVANSGTIKITSGTATFYTPLATDETNAADGSTNGLWVIGAHDTLVMNATSVDNTQTFDFTSPSAAALVIGQVPQASTTEFDTFNGQTMPSLTGSIAPGAPNVLPGWNAPIENYQSGDVIVLQGLTYRSATAAGDVVTVWSGAGGTGSPLGSLTFVTKSDAPSSAEAAAAANQINALACFAAGTRIETATGPVAVERLHVGDALRTVRIFPPSHGLSSASCTGGELNERCEPIVWIGSRTVNCARHPRPETVWPVKVRAGAFATGTPRCDLYLSPNHAVFIDGVLIPVTLLINGTSITRVRRDHVTYYHVELPEHAVILAEELPVESYLDTGDRADFEAGVTIRLAPDFAARLAPDAAMTWETRGAAPLVMAGPMLEAARLALSGVAPERRSQVISTAA